MSASKAMRAILFGGVLALAASLPAQAQKAPTTITSATSDPGNAAVTQTTTVSAKIVGIDHSKRLLQVKFADGKVRELEAGAEVQNFDRLAVGDDINAKYVEALSLELRKAGSATLKDGVTEATTRRMVDGKPAATVGRLITAVSEVVSIDAKTQTITLRNPDGHLVDLEVKNPAQLKNVAPGDNVEAIYTEALALEVTAAR